VTEAGRVTGIRGHRKDESTITERAQVVVGADGHHSLVARSVKAQQYNAKPALQVSYYTYVSGLPMDGRYEVCLRPDRGFAAWATNDNLTVVIGGWPRSELATNRKDIEGNFLATLGLLPDFAARFSAGKRESRFVGMSLANFMRKPFGPGWTLVGDAGYTKDFITALGISDAFRDAGLCPKALDEAFSGARPFEEAMAAYQHERDRARFRSTSSPHSWRRFSPCHPSSSGCWTLCTATRTRWMDSRASPAASRPRRTSSPSSTHDASLPGEPSP
jgi:2-polyprenyl-6-methoxyphenol hydroxylase-like FAD-dependent oxidoreductase